MQAARNGVQIDNTEIFITASPCYDCFKMIANAGIKIIYYGEFYREERIITHAKELGIELVHLEV
jgi:dCMP deaminase